METEPNIVGFVRKYSNGVWLNWLSQEGFDKNLGKLPLDEQIRYWFNSHF